MTSQRGNGKKFVAIIEKKYSNSDYDVPVLFLKATSTTTKFAFPDVEDRSSLDFSAILHVLTPPEMGRHTEVVFSIDPLVA